MSELSLSEIRRQIHSFPELGRQERATTKLVAQELEDIGLLPIPLPTGTGLYCDIIGDPEGPVVALRADMDALPVQDLKTVPYRSTNPGVCHACGHDVHTTMLLGAARRLAPARPDIRGTIRLIFQPAEESIMSGSLEVIASGALEGVSAIYALHCDPSKIVGQVGFRDGAITSANDRIGVKITGKGGHSARPHLTVNPINLIGEVITQLPARVYGKLGADNKALVGFGSVHSGDANNAIPSTAEAAGTVRIADPDVWADLPELVEETLGEILNGYDAHWELEYNRVCPTVVNDPLVNSYFRAAATKLFGSDNVIDTHQSFGGEDFAWYLQTVPGALARIGVRPIDATYQADLHSGTFDVDEGVLEIGAALMDEVGRLAVSSYAKA